MQTCQNENCGKPSSMQCPKCISLGFPPSYFCSQECFKAAWPTHKNLHTLAASLASLTSGPSALREEFAGYSFSGSVRPGVISPRRSVPASIKKPEYADSGDPTSERAVKSQAVIKTFSAKEIEGIRKACKISREVLDIAAAAVKPGVTTDEIDRIVHEATIERDSYPSPLNYKGFPKSVCTSVNEVICHGIPDSRELQEGDIVNVDVSCYHDGYHGDVNGTYPVGKIDAQSDLLIKTTREALDKAIEMVRPGALYREVGNVITKVVQAQGFSVVRSYCGHGIGDLFHGAPSIPHYSKNKAVGVMKAGHIFTIEPMINMGSYHDQLWPDNWTCTTRDGKRSAQFEETILVTDTDKGHEVLTGATPTQSANSS